MKAQTKIYELYLITNDGAIYSFTIPEPLPHEIKTLKERFRLEFEGENNRAYFIQV